ncbi:TRAP transporter permease [Neobacillus drentensis]|uniref:TRAP transporter permease n=1 Tax=Neobacillus drentensis TaxID=220684 RepID=UPI0008256629|nr:TRAP transporter permease [Neobacillus drentensis]
MESVRKNSKAIASVVLLLSVALSLFQLYTSGFGVLTAMLQRSFHLTLVLVLIFLIYPIHSSKYLRWIDFVLVGFSIASGLYIFRTYEDLLFRVGNPDTWDMVLGIATMILVLEATRRVAGNILALIGSIFLIYAYFGEYFPGIFQHSNMSLNRIVSLVYLSTDGLWGETLGVAATFVAMFIIFGAFLNSTGAGKVFIDLAYIVGGRYRGGPAKVAVVSSGLMGTMSGSPVANVASIGHFTIPLMKKIGYSPQVAASIEAVASTGGSIMPPIMGAGAFVMAELTGISYSKIVIAAIIPAILYYLSIFTFVDFEAARKNMIGLSKDQLPHFKKIFFKGIHLYTGLFTLIYLLVFAKVSPMNSAFYSIIVLVGTYVVVYFKQIKWKFIIEALESSAKSMLLVTAACATAGIVVGVINLTGIGVTLTTLLVNIGENSLLLTLIVTMIACIIMGMGLPPTASYILLAVLTAPALINLGVNILVAHMFVFYFSCLAPITPPVALASYTAAGIAGSDPLRTGITSARIGLVAFLIPYMFVYGPALLAQGSLGNILLSLFMAIIGVITLAAALAGWFKRELVLYERVFALVISLLLIYSGLITDLIGLGLLVIFFLLVTFTHKELNTKKYVASKNNDNVEATS